MPRNDHDDLKSKPGRAMGERFECQSGGPDCPNRTRALHEPCDVCRAKPGEFCWGNPQDFPFDDDAAVIVVTAVPRCRRPRPTVQTMSGGETGEDRTHKWAQPPEWLAGLMAETCPAPTPEA